MNNIKKNFYLTRRSVTAKNMDSKLINKEDLEIILSAGVRVPDHGALSPWRIIVMQGESLKEIDKKIIYSEYKKNNPKKKEEEINIQSFRLQRASAVIAVISSPINHSTIPKWEMQLSAGAVCMNILSSAQSMGYAAQWLTEWYAYNDKMLVHLGGELGKDKIAGFIYIGYKKEEPLERKRPEISKIVKYL